MEKEKRPGRESGTGQMSSLQVGVDERGTSLGLKELLAEE